MEGMIAILVLVTSLRRIQFLVDVLEEVDETEIRQMASVATIFVKE